MPRAWRSGIEGARLTGLMIDGSPRGPDQPGFLGILEADSLSSSSIADIPPSQPRLRPHSLQAGDQTVPDIQERARAPGLQAHRQAEVPVSPGHLDLHVPTVGDSTLESATGLQAHVLFVAVRATS